MSDLSNPATFHGVPIRHTCEGCGEVMNCDHFPPGTNVVGSHDPPSPEDMEKLAQLQRRAEWDRRTQLVWLILGLIGAVVLAFAVVLQQLGVK